MKKKLLPRRPLRLKAETVRVLDRKQMETIAGGTSSGCQGASGGDACLSGGCDTWQ